MTALSGVRSSCDMLARNCDFKRLATASCWPFSAISWKSRAFSMASTDWAAKVCSNFTTDSGNSPLSLLAADGDRADNPLLAQERHRQYSTDAFAQQEIAQPVACLSYQRPAIWHGARCSAHMPIVVSPRRICDSRKVSTASSLKP